MRRDRIDFLYNWLDSKDRRPLIIRGARQVGKTWLIRHLAASRDRVLIELNFEKRPDFESLFSSNDPKEVIVNIGASTGRRIEPSKAILFLDEIQAAPRLIPKLRWFAEDLPELPVIAAGSLLEFALAKHEFSMPVGRVGYLYMEPLSFEEFLDAVGEGELRIYLKNYAFGVQIPSAVHTGLTKRIKEYLIVGGMPAAVSSWVTEQAPDVVNRIHFDLLATYRDDFAKYSGRLTPERLEEVMRSVPRQLGKKFVYKDVNSEISAAPLKQALDLLSKSGICRRVLATSANGLPLGAEVDDRFVKVIMLDIGLCGASLGLSLHGIRSIAEIAMINGGGIAEQLTGQLLCTLSPGYIPPSLHYWQREKKGAEAEVDYIIQHQDLVIPVEVKAGKTGTLKSLRQFVREKNKKIAVRINSDLPTVGVVEGKDSFGVPVSYTLLSIPFYLIGQLHRLLNGSEL